MWHTQVSAEVGYRYYQIVKKYYDLSCDNYVNPRRLLGDFSMRGQQSVESAIKSSAAWCLSFYNTATVPAILWLEDNYNCDCTTDNVAYGAISTEHSVMCSNYAIDGNEITHIRRLLTEIYPHHSFSMVSDSYDYWNLVEKILPHLKDEIMAHDGCLSIHGDSGDPVEIIAGKEIIYLNEREWKNLKDDPSEFIAEFFERDLDKDTQQIFSYNGEYALADITVEWTNERGAWTDCKYWFIEGYNVKLTKNYELTSEDKGTVWCLWDIFGGTINSKGYKVLDPHIKAIYGDSITPQRCARIYQHLVNNGFAINNVSLGVGSFSFMCLEEDGTFNPYTRDTFGIAVKATYAEDANGKPIMIYKQPKALSWKKSQKGCCAVALDGQSYTDEHTRDEVINMPNLLQPVFQNGILTKEYTLDEVRDNMYPEGE